MPARRLAPVEFVAMMAMMFATIAFSIDAMLPALPQIGQELSPQDINRAQLILTFFVLGMGLGTFFTGPLSDSFGRKPVILAGAALYILAAALAWVAPTLELVLAARLLQGLGAAGPRVVTLAIIRDLYSGREMARLMSFVMMVFTLVPAIAPLLGALIIDVAGWRGVFLAFIAFSVLSVGWMALRLAEPLPRARRLPFRPAVLAAATRELFSIPAVRVSIAVQALCFAMLFGMLSSVQQIYDITFGRGDSFPLWFGAIAVVAGTSSLLNAALVMRLGMRFLVTATLAVQVAISAVMLGVFLADLPLDMAFYAFVFWQTTVFFQAGMTLGNINSLAMEPVGHIAGLAASVIGAVATVFGVALAIPVGMAFDGTPAPLAAAICLLALLAVMLMARLRRIEASQPA